MGETRVVIGLVRAAHQLAEALEQHQDPGKYIPHQLRGTFGGTNGLRLTRRAAPPVVLVLPARPA